ncbi:MAG TPA: lysophospholipid acyltransferase family protein, partial [Anaerolineales bacterium]
MSKEDDDTQVDAQLGAEGELDHPFSEDETPEVPIEGDTLIEAALDEQAPAEGALPEAASPVEEEAAFAEPSAGSMSGEASDLPDEEARRQLAEELDKLIDRVKAATPDYTPPSFSPQRLVRLISQNLDRFSPEMRQGILEKLRSSVTEDLFDLDTWRGIWYMVNYSLEAQTDVLKRRLTGEYEIDEWGYDPEVLDAVKPFFDFMYKTYWRVEISGIENVPDEGRALLVSNHSGQLPWDGAMVGMAILNEHPAQRLVRTLYATWFPTLPFISALFTKCGQALATEENGIRLLEQDQLVAVYPEGYKGVGKLFRERYRLARFGRGGFVRMALKTQAPMIPVSVVGA